LTKVSKLPLLSVPLSAEAYPTNNVFPCDGVTEVEQGMLFCPVPDVVAPEVFLQLVSSGVEDAFPVMSADQQSNPPLGALV
jgi:hypothetical protein